MYNFIYFYCSQRFQLLRFSLEVFLGYKFLKLRSIISPYVSLTERRKSCLFDLHACIGTMYIYV